MRGATKALLAGAALLLAVAGCSRPTYRPIQEEIRVGDRQREWALVYFLSWKRHGDPRYLRLSRRHLSEAVRTYFDLQVRIGHSFPDFYLIDRKRVAGCRFLGRIDNLARRFRVAFEEQDSEGCLR